MRQMLMNTTKFIGFDLKKHATGLSPGSLNYLEFGKIYMMRLALKLSNTAIIDKGNRKASIILFFIAYVCSCTSV